LITTRSFNLSLLLTVGGLLLAAPAVGDVKVITDQQTVIVKGNLKSIQVLPPKPAARKKQPAATKKKPPAKKKIAAKVRPQRPAGPTTLRVGPNAPYKKPSDAARVARDGDTIEIAAGIYEDCAIWRANNLTIRGVGGRAHLRDVTCQRKAIFITRGENTTIENIEFSGMYVGDKNGAGIRHEGKGLIVRNSYFHDGEQGILGGGQKPGDTILIEDSEFARLGRVGQAHGIYINEADRLTVQRSYFHDCRDEGHCLKSRAKHSIIRCNVIASLEGNSSYELDFPNGGLVEVRDNIIEQGPKSVNYAIVSFAGEARRHSKRNPKMTLILEGNTIINDHPRGKLFRMLRFENTKIVSRNNRYIGIAPPDFGENDKRFPSRRTAGLKPYPALPKACEK